MEEVTQDIGVINPVINQVSEEITIKVITEVIQDTAVISQEVIKGTIADIIEVTEEVDTTTVGVNQNPVLTLVKPIVMEIKSEP